MWFAFIATAVVALLIYLLVNYKSKKGFWKKYGVPEIDISGVVSSLDLILARKSQIVSDDYIYSKLGDSAKFGGFVEQGNPMILIKDEELLKKVFVKDFDSFADRREFFSEADGCLVRMLPVLKGEEWKGVRTSLSPTFTTGKIRRMMEIFNGVGKEWAEELTKKAGENSGEKVIDVTSTVNQFTVDVIASTAFGMNAGTVKNPKSEFSTMAYTLGNFTMFDAMKAAFRFQFPWLALKLGVSIVDKGATKYFEELLAQGLKQRMSGEVKRNDFLQLLVELKKGGGVKAVGSDELSAFEKEAEIKANPKSKEEYLTPEIINAQLVMFFFAGFSTTTSFITFALYALAEHQDVQERLREEVNGILKEDGTFNYDDLNHLVYMDMFSCEVLRKFSVAARLERVCTKEYRDPNTGLVVPKGTVVVIPVHSLHHEKKHYDNPDSFDPEHFTPEKKAKRSPLGYLPFGMGPRNCIGMRFALVQGMAAVAHIVSRFKIEPTDKTPLPAKAVFAGLQIIPPPGLELKLTPIKN